jgi:lysyl-tRNA synthetase class 2
MDATHNPEFTMMESYQAFGDVADVIDLTETLVVNAARDAVGSTVIDIAGTQVDLAETWPRLRMADAVSEAVAAPVHPTTPVETVRAIAETHGVRWEPSWGSGKLIEELFEKVCEDAIVRPTFVVGHPVEVSPLARADPADPHVADRFELFINGSEYANGYSELNDPVEQRHRFEDEQAAKDAGDLERGSVDEDYLRALEYGLPPTAGLGVGIDRLVMLLAGVHNIKDVILFPTLRPEPREDGR